jgi:hypothetical protein
MVTKKFTVEFEVNAESNATVYGEDFLYVLFEQVGRAVTEVGYDFARVRYHNGRNSRTFVARPGDPVTITEGT